MPRQTTPDAVRLRHVARDDLERLVPEPKARLVANDCGHTMALCESELSQRAPNASAGTENDQLHSQLPVGVLSRVQARGCYPCCCAGEIISLATKRDARARSTSSGLMDLPRFA